MRVQRFELKSAARVYCKLPRHQPTCTHLVAFGDNETVGGQRRAVAGVGREEFSAPDQHRLHGRAATLPHGPRVLRVSARAPAAPLPQVHFALNQGLLLVPCDPYLQMSRIDLSLQF